MNIILEYQDMQDTLFDCFNKRNKIMMKGFTKHRLLAQEIINGIEE